jgi:hypothetical protein
MSGHDTLSGRLDCCYGLDHCRWVDAFELACRRIRRLAVNGLSIVRTDTFPMSGGYSFRVALKSSIVVADWPGHVSSLGSDLVVCWEPWIFHFIHVIMLVYRPAR